MNYYTVLEATNRLILQHHWILQRCRREPIGLLRYVVVDQHGLPAIDDHTPARRHDGFTLHELLLQLSDQEQGKLSNSAKRLLQQLNDISELEQGTHKSW